MASRGVIELAVSRAVEETFPLVPVEYQNSLFGVACHPHEDPLGPIRGCWAAVRRRCRAAGRRRCLAGGRERCRAAGRGRKGDLDRAVAVTRATPGLPGEVNTEIGDRGLGGHGFLATPQ